MLVPFIHVGRPSVVGSPGWWMYQFTAEGVSRIAVPFFFICSGYFLSKHFADKCWYSAEVRKRIKTLLTPYVLWSLIFYLFISALYMIAPDSPVCYRIAQKMPVFSRILLAFGLSPEKLPMLYPLWYLRFLFVMVLVSPVFSAGYKHFKSSLLIFLAALYLTFNPGEGSPIGVHIGFPFEGVFYFYCGILLHDDKIRTNVKRVSCKPIMLLGGGAFTLILARALIVRYVGHSFCLIKPLFIPLSLITVWSVISKNAWSNKFASLSFLVYVTHVFGLQLFSFVFGRDSDNVWMLLGRVSFGLCFAFCLSYLLKNVVGSRVSLLWGGRR